MSNNNIRTFLKNTLCRISPELYSKYLFRRILGKGLDLKNPQGMNEKLMWLKLKRYGKDPLVSKCADKYAVREYVEACGCGDILNELYGVWEKAEDIEWSKLPGSFVIKCNHGCGYNIICPDKASIDTNEISVQLSRWLEEEYWLKLGEIHYRSIPKRIICEKFLGEKLVDYKVYCFNGKPEYILVCVGRERGLPCHTREKDVQFYFFDSEWNLCRITRDGLCAPDGFTIPKPSGFDNILSVSKVLSEPFPFVRVDLYDVEGQIVFGELTFTPSAAMDIDRLDETDKMFGAKVNTEKY